MTREQMIQQAVEAWDRAIEEYEPTDEERAAEEELERWCNDHPVT